MTDLSGVAPPSARGSRRRFVGAALVSALSLPGRPTHTRGALWPADRRSRPRFAANPFGLGVASGEPAPDGVVLWTRLAPDPLAEDGLGGLTGHGGIEVVWEVAADEGFGRTVRRGVATASPEFAHSLHVEVGGLEAGRAYHYRFRVGDAVSPVGRTRTAPRPHAPLDRFRLAVTSCQHWEQGYYAAYADLARRAVDLVVHLGDYIYESPDTGAAALEAGEIVRRHLPGEAVTLADYRRRYGLYKSDPDLRAAHASAPWVAVWDDHEVVNDYTGEAVDGVALPEFLDRRAAAYQAYYEHLPLRAAARPDGAGAQLYRRLDFGDLLGLHLLDTRQYRALPPCGRGIREPCPTVDDPAATMLGDAQEDWLFAGLAASGATWNAIGQQVMMARLDLQVGEGLSIDDRLWDAYPVARRRLLGHLPAAGVVNPVVLTGDIHSSWVNELRADFDDPASPVVATEFVGTSISSGGEPTLAERLQIGAFVELLGQENPHVRYFEGAHRGYVLHDISPKVWRADYRFTSSVKQSNTAVGTAASFVVESGRPGAVAG